MEESLKFNSAVCTTREQSQRLLDMGLKPETADMAWVCVTKEGLTQWVMTLNTPKNKPNIDTPAWSLHRLLEIAIKGNKTFGLDITNKNNIDYCYERLICDIDGLINAKAFNKEYLKQ